MGEVDKRLVVDKAAAVAQITEEGLARVFVVIAIILLEAFTMANLDWCMVL